MTPLKLGASTSATYHISGETIPYWYYLRVLYLLSTCSFALYSHSNIAFVRAGLRAEGYEISDKLVAALTKEYLVLTPREKFALRSIDPPQIRARHNEINCSTTMLYLDAITPRSTVNPSELLLSNRMLPKVTFGLQIPPVVDDAQTDSKAWLTEYEAEDREAANIDDDIQEHDNFDLSCTSTPITEFNYKDFLHSYPVTPTEPIVQYSPLADTHQQNHISLVGRTSEYGGTRVDGYASIRRHSPYKPIGTSSNPVGDSDDEEPLLGSRVPGNKDTTTFFRLDALHPNSLASKTSTVTDLVRSKPPVATTPELTPFSRWSAERFSFTGLGSEVDADTSIHLQSGSTGARSVPRKSATVFKSALSPKGIVEMSGPQTGGRYPL